MTKRNILLGSQTYCPNDYPTKRCRGEWGTARLWECEDCSMDADDFYGNGQDKMAVPKEHNT